MTKLAPYLTLSGALPFVACAACLVIGVTDVPLFGNVQTLLASYAIVILSFMSGVHWGQHLHIDATAGQRLALISNVITLSGWFAYLLAPFGVTLITCAIGFILLLMIDVRLRTSGHLTASYLGLRVIVTGIVVMSLAVAVIWA